jgi:hypothetical protein
MNPRLLSLIGLLVLAPSPSLAQFDPVETSVELFGTEQCPYPAQNNQCWNFNKFEAVLAERGHQGWHLTAVPAPLLAAGQLVDNQRINAHTADRSSVLLIFERPTSSAMQDSLQKLQTDVRNQIAQMTSVREDLLRIVQDGLAASLIERYQAPLREEICAYVERRLDERLRQTGATMPPPSQTNACREPEKPRPQPDP